MLTKQLGLKTDILYLQFFNINTTYRYIPLGLLEQQPQCINERPPQYVGRNDLETLFASGDCRDWVKIRWVLNCMFDDTKCKTISALQNFNSKSCKLYTIIRGSF